MVVYRHIRLDKNEVFYVGIGDNKRPYKKSDRNKIWKNIVSKTGYRIEILFSDLTLEEACEKEKEFISLYGRIDLNTGTLANLTNGGDYYGCVGYRHNDELKKRFSEERMGISKSEEVKIKISKTLTGRKLSDSTKEKISRIHKGRPKSDTFKNKIIDTNMSRYEYSILDLETGIFYSDRKSVV